MRRINKILIVFIILSIATIYGGWRFLHSERFSMEASKRVSKLLEEKLGVKLVFEKVKFGMFPPSTTFQNVKVYKKTNNNFLVDVALEEFEVNFSYTSFIANTLEIEELVLKNGFFTLQTGNEDTPDIEWKKIKIDELMAKYQSFYNQLPIKVNLIKFENINTSIDDVKLKLSKLSLMPHKKEVRLKAMATDLIYEKEIENLNLKKIKSINVLVKFDKKALLIDELKINDEILMLSLNGKITQDKKSLKVESDSEINLSINRINEYFKKPLAEFKSFEGLALLKIKMSSELWNPDVNLTAEINQFKSDYFKSENVIIGAEKKNHQVILKDLKVKNVNEKYRLLKPVALFDLNKNEFFKTRGSLQVENGFTNTFLYAIRDSLEPFKGYVTGKIDVAFDGAKVLFIIPEAITLKDFKLSFPKSTKPLLQNPGFKVENSTITLDAKNNVGINANISMFETLLKINGVIDPKEINLVAIDSKINMNAFGPISGVKINGSGPIEVKVSGPYDDVRFDFEANWKKFSLIDLNFGDVKAAFSLSLADVILSIEKLEGKFNQSQFDATGWLKFGDASGLDLKLNFPNTNFADARNMYGLVFNGLKLPPDLALKFETQYRVFGSFDLADLKIDGKVKGRELKAYGEDFESVTFSMGLNNKNLSFTNLKLKKGRGDIQGSANISLANNYAEVEASGVGIRLSDLNFYKKFGFAYDSDLSLEYDGNGTSDNYSSRLKFRTIDPYIATYPASHSNGLVYLSSNDIVAKINMLGNKVKIDSIYDFASKEISFKSTIDTQDLRELFGVVSGHNILDRSVSGVAKGSINTKFNADTLNISSFNLDVKQFRLKRDEVDLKILPNKNIINIENGNVKRWDIGFTDGNEFFNSKGYNTENKSIILEQNFNIKSNILELFSDFVEKSRGNIKGNNQIVINKDITFKEFKISSNNGSLKFKKIPGFITNLNYDIVKNGTRFELQKLVGKYGEGDFKASGYLIFDDLFPLVNMEFRVDRSIIPVFKKSTVMLSATGLITGTELPYNLNSKATILQGEILDDPADIVSDSKVSLSEFNKYLPTKSDGSSTGYMNLNVSFDTQNNIAIKNNMAEVYFKANGNVNGTIINPEIVTKVDVQPTISKFKFKGHDFLLNQGNLEIQDKGKVRSSQMKFVGLARVNEYDVKLDISGKLDKMDIVLSSEPYSSQEDILSLLTIGVTSDMNKNLDPTERAAITRLGIGTMFLNQLKINEDINNTIGVNVSVLPEFQEEDSSLVAGGKSAVSESSTSKLKSATKIKINKKLTNKLDVSVSSTVGGSIEQKQEMNANYNVNKNMSVEGVYEIKPAEDESTATPTSLGIDLKFKWSF